MKILIPVELRNHAYRLLIVLVLIIASVQTMHASVLNESVKIKDDIKIKRTSDGNVSLFVQNPSGPKEEYRFTDFNADVILLLYRGVDLDMIIKNLAKKYFLTKTDTRRYVKMTINTLEQWNLVSRM